MDGLFAIAFNRDLELMDMLLRLALYLVINVSFAMFFMFWIFVFRLPAFISTFGATWVCSICILAIFSCIGYCNSFLSSVDRLMQSLMGPHRVYTAVLVYVLLCPSSLVVVCFYLWRSQLSQPFAP
jgi:hypothetical protein